jgi:hypothetical protein
MKPVSLCIAFAAIGSALFLGCASASKSPAPSVGGPAPARGFQHRVFTDAEGKKHPFVIFVPATCRR